MSDYPIDFYSIPLAPIDEVFEVLNRFNNDTDQNKVNFSIGAYRNEEGKPWVLPVVKATELSLAQDPLQNHEYPPISGLQAFNNAAAKLCLGPDSPIILECRYCTIQTPGGTGAVRLGLTFISKFNTSKVIYFSDPTWSNHKEIARVCGFTEIKSYRYYSSSKLELDIDGMLEDLRAAPPNSTVVLQGIADNPTGIDPSHFQWQNIAKVMKENNLFPFVDFAYQGFASGDCDRDAMAVRYLVKEGFNLLIAASFSANFGLYNDRVGALIVTSPSSESASCVLSQLKYYCRRFWSCPPNHGGRIVATILNNPALLVEWKDNLRAMATRIQQMRQALYDRLKVLGTSGSWEHIITQIGMFCYTGLKSKQVAVLTSRYHIYLLKSGRINVCGLNYTNLDYVAKAIHDVVSNEDTI